jgi:hypothetical protein
MTGDGPERPPAEPRREMTDQEVFARARRIWRQFVPASGPADFEQGELLRAVEKLRDEAQRNANANFTDGCHGRLVAYLRERLPDPHVFDADATAEIGADLSALGTVDHPYLDDDVYDRLRRRVVEWCEAHPEPVPRTPDPDLRC